jgi:hypothetical protein
MTELLLSRPHLRRWLEYLLAALLVAIALASAMWFFTRWPIENTMLAIDWRGLWTGLRGPRPVYGNDTGLLITPWNAILLMPLGRLSFGASWGVLAVFTLGVLIASVPRQAQRARHLLAVGLLTTSYLSLRLLADGNFEGIIILGLLLIVAAWPQRRVWLMAAGLLLATTKPQEVWILMLALGYYLLASWPAQRWLRLAGLLAVVVVPSLLWLGADWVRGMVNAEMHYHWIDPSLPASLNRLGAPIWLTAAAYAAFAAANAFVIWRSRPEVTREKVAMFVAASLLLAPYAACNSYLTVLAVGLVPMGLRSLRLGLLIALLIDVLFLIPKPIMFHYSAWYFSLLLFGAWALCLAHVWRAEVRPRPAGAAAA